MNTPEDNLTMETFIELPTQFKYQDIRKQADKTCHNQTLIEKHEPDVPTTRPSATLSHLQAIDILKENGNSLDATPVQLRNLVLNSLILETQSEKASERISALVNIGKITEVGLFTDKKELKVTHQNSEELREKLRESLLELKENAKGIYEVEKLDA
tara:strand:- start:57 stop:527 length:471 start_codon:yes stop_codon:yes gene_type:complete